MFDGQQKKPDKVEKGMLVGGTTLDGRVRLGEGFQRVRALYVFA